jgi:hypothetical protein
MKTKYSNYKYRASVKERSFCIKREIFLKLEQSACLYCGEILEGTLNGIDRIDNNMGYEDSNITACCWSCNRWKGNSTMEDFLKKLLAVVKHNAYLIDDSLSLEEKTTLDFKRRLKSNVLDLKPYEEDCYDKFVLKTQMITNLDEELLNKVKRVSTYNTNLRTVITKWCYGIDTQYGKEITNAYFNIFDKPKFLTKEFEDIRPDLLKILIQSSLQSFTKKERKVIKNVNIKFIVDNESCI